MLERYSRKQTAHIWSSDFRLNAFLRIELLAIKAMADCGIVPASDAALVLEAAPRLILDENRIKEIEAETHHDFISFLTHITEQLGPEGRWLHYGLTSSDVLDAALAIQLVEVSGKIEESLDACLAQLRRLALEHEQLLCIGRSHGVHGEPITFGIKLARFYAALARCKRRLRDAKSEIAVCTFSGAMGTFAHSSPEVEARIADALGLQVEPVATQVVARDRHAQFFTALGVTAAVVEQLATEIRHLQQSEIAEVAEGFADKQKGSSAMPHKRNPILSENLCGLMRIVRSSIAPALETVNLWYERDMSNSSVERMQAATATVTLDFALDRLATVLQRLEVNKANMTRNLMHSKKLIHSQQLLLALARHSVGRDEAYGWVQRVAMQAHAGQQDFQQLALQDNDITGVLSAKEINECFDLERHRRYAKELVSRGLSLDH